MVRLCLLRPGSLSRTDQKQMARSRSRDRHDRGAVLACSRRARRISGRLWRWRWDGDPKSTKRHRGSEFCRELRGRTVCFCCGCGSDTAADVMIAGRRYHTFVLAWYTKAGVVLCNSFSDFPSTNYAKCSSTKRKSVKNAFGFITKTYFIFVDLSIYFLDLLLLERYHQDTINTRICSRRNV